MLPHGESSMFLVLRTGLILAVVHWVLWVTLDGKDWGGASTNGSQ